MKQPLASTTTDILDVRDIFVNRCDSRDIRSLVCQYHYSGSICQNSQYSYAIFIGGNIIGAAQFGPPLCYEKVLPLVRRSTKSDMLELNRFVLLPGSPKNSASKALSLCFKSIKSYGYKWILSYCNAIQSGNGSIYRATGFHLTDIKLNNNSKHPSLFRLPCGGIYHVMNFKRTVNTKIGRKVREAVGMHTESAGKVLHAFGAKPIEGHILRYIKFLDRSWEKYLVPKKLKYESARAIHAETLVNYDVNMIDYNLQCQLRLF